MTNVAVVIDDSEHMCCGEHRKVGDVVTIPVQNYEGTIYEDRHGHLVGQEAQTITGTVLGIRWRPAIRLWEGDYARRRVGYEPGVPVDSTEYDDPVVTEWAFEFTIETEAQIPNPRSA